jgi:hypothetical protein
MSVIQTLAADVTKQAVAKATGVNPDDIAVNFSGTNATISDTKPQTASAAQTAPAAQTAFQSLYAADGHNNYARPKPLGMIGSIK